VGNQVVKFRDVKKITDPRLATTDQNVKDVTNLDLKKDDVKVQTEKEGNVEQQNSSMNSGSVAKSNIMNSVGLSREMMEKIAKETAK
jgi:flagellar basal-body rod modification protein FlgD